MDAFISYRRDGGADVARLVHDSLERRGLQVFLDREGLKEGRFDSNLCKNIDNSPNFLLILSPGCLDRCVNEGDWVRREIEYAMSRNKNIIPIALEKFKAPDNLPISLQSILMYNWLNINHEYFEASIDKLMTMLKGISRQPQQPVQPQGLGLGGSQGGYFVNNNGYSQPYYPQNNGMNGGYMPPQQVSFNGGMNVNTYGQPGGNQGINVDNNPKNYTLQIDELELRRFRAEDHILARYEYPIIRKLVEGRGGLICLDINVHSVESVFARLDHPEITGVIALSTNQEIVDRGNSMVNGRSVIFCKVDFDSDGFVAELQSALSSVGISVVDFVCLNMAIMEFKRPFKVLQAVRGYLNSGATMIVTDIDDGAVFAYPDKDGLFAKFQTFYAEDKYRVHRNTGRQAYHYVRSMSPVSVCLEKFGINTSDMSRQEKGELFESWFGYIQRDFEHLLQLEPANVTAKEVIGFCNEYFDDISEQYFAPDTIFSSGYVIYSVKF